MAPVYMYVTSKRGKRILEFHKKPQKVGIFLVGMSNWQ